jgi:hypothetical protein
MNRFFRFFQKTPQIIEKNRLNFSIFFFFQLFIFSFSII